MDNKKLKELREKLRYGTRIRLIHMNAGPDSVPDGAIGKVTEVDNSGRITVAWENYVSYGTPLILPEEDEFEIIR